MIIFAFSYNFNTEIYTSINSIKMEFDFDNPIDKSIESVIHMNKREFDHHIQSFTDGASLISTILHLIGIINYGTHKVSYSTGFGSKSKKNRVSSITENIDYINSSSISVMIKHLMCMNYEVHLYNIMTIISNIKVIKNCLIYALLDYTSYLSDKSDSGVLLEYIITLIHDNDLWIPEEHLELLEHKINLFSSYFINPKKVTKILAKYPHFNHYGVSLFTECGVSENDISTIINQQLYSINKKMTKIQRKKWLKDYQCYLNDGINHIIDGHNIFFNINFEKTNMIDLNMIKSFIDNHKTDNLLFVFNAKHKAILDTIVKSYDTTVNTDASSQHGVMHIRFIFTPRGKDDDLVSLSLWMSNITNILHSKDMFDNHVKHFHNNQYWYSFWKWFHSTHSFNV